MLSQQNSEDVNMANLRVLRALNILQAGVQSAEVKPESKESFIKMLDQDVNSKL